MPCQIWILFCHAGAAHQNKRKANCKTEINLKNSITHFWSRWQLRQTRLTSSHNHIKITTKLLNNHHSEPSEIELTTTELKKPHPSRLVEGEETRQGLVPHPHVVDKNLEGISSELGVPVLHQVPSQGFRCQEDKSPNFWLQKLAGTELGKITSGAPWSSS